MYGLVQIYTSIFCIAICHSDHCGNIKTPKKIEMSWFYKSHCSGTMIIAMSRFSGDSTGHLVHSSFATMLEAIRTTDDKAKLSAMRSGVLRSIAQNTTPEDDGKKLRFGGSWGGVGVYGSSTRMCSGSGCGLGSPSRGAYSASAHGGVPM